MRWFMVIVLSTTLSACKEGNPDGNTYIPDVTGHCDQGQAADCAGTGLNMFVGLATSLSADCDDFLTNLNATQRRESFQASGTTVSTRQGVYLVATVATWIAPGGGVVDVLPEGTYQVCAFVDSNGNGQLNTDEPVGRGQLRMGDNTFLLTDWRPAYN